MNEHEKRIREALEEDPFLTAMVSKVDLRALLADLDRLRDNLDAVRGALSAAKDGGWVAVPVEPTVDMLVAAHDAEHCGNHEPHFANAYRAMLAARPLPNPPKEQNT